MIDKLEKFEFDGETEFKVETRFDGSGFSITRISLCGIIRLARKDGCSTTYCITSGEGIMIIDGVETELHPGDTVDVSQDAEYVVAGDFTAVAMSIPPYDESKVTVIE